MEGGERFKFWSAAFLVLEKDGKMLLMQRKNSGHRDGEYQFIAGHIEKGETPQRAIVREAMEETGVVVEEKDLRVVHVQLRQDADRTYYDVYMTAERWEGEPQIMEPEKCADMQWFPKDALPPETIDYIRAVTRYVIDGRTYSNWGF